MRQVVARLSTTVLLGEGAVDNKEWIDISISYSSTLFLAQRELRHWSHWTRRIVQWFLPHCKELRRQFARAHDIVTPIVEKRLKQIALAEKGMAEMPRDAVGVDARDCQGTEIQPSWYSAGPGGGSYSHFVRLNVSFDLESLPPSRVHRAPAG